MSRRHILVLALAGVSLAAFQLVEGCVGDLPTALDASTDAPADAVGDGGVACGDGGTMCGAACIDTRVDPSNCGACGNVCEASTCFEGACNGARAHRVAIGNNFACVVRTSGTVWCWGRNDVGQLGAPSGSGEVPCGATTGTCREKPGPVQGLNDVKEIAASTSGGMCAVKKDGTVWCWGQNSVGPGELGHDPNTDENCGVACARVPRQVAGITGAQWVSMGEDSTCITTLAGDAFCWGNNLYGQLGAGGGASPGGWQPQRVVLPQGVKADIVQVGIFHACATTSDGMYCWGVNHQGQLGPNPDGGADPSCLGGDPCSSTPRKIVGLNQPTWPVAGDGFSCALLANGEIWCLGFSGTGITQLPLGTNATSPVKITGLPKAWDATGRVAHLCAPTFNDGGVYCWGDAELGKLGVPNEDAGPCGGGPCRSTPVLVQTPGPVNYVNTSGSSSLAMLLDGRVAAWGANRGGQLGHLPGSTGDTLCAKSPSDAAIYCNPTPQLIPGIP
jgi:alpha-tubulin suppressor-like RCC1 family protein